MKTYNFSLTCSLDDPSRGMDEVVDALFETGCDDALVVEKGGVYILEFDRVAPSFSKALFSALRAVRSAGLKPYRVGPDPLVSASEIAERSGLSRQAVSLFAKGARGEGFPAPAIRAETNSPLWRWVDVQHWMRERRGEMVSEDAIALAGLVERANRRVFRGSDLS